MRPALLQFLFIPSISLACLKALPSLSLMHCSMLCQTQVSETGVLGTQTCRDLDHQLSLPGDGINSIRLKHDM